MRYVIALEVPSNDVTVGVPDQQLPSGIAVNDSLASVPSGIQHFNVPNVRFFLRPNLAALAIQKADTTATVKADNDGELAVAAEAAGCRIVDTGPMSGGLPTNLSLVVKESRRSGPTFIPRQEAIGSRQIQSRHLNRAVLFHGEPDLLLDLALRVNEVDSVTSDYRDFGSFSIRRPAYEYLRDAADRIPDIEGMCFKESVSYKNARRQHFPLSLNAFPGFTDARLGLPKDVAWGANEKDEKDVTTDKYFPQHMRPSLRTLPVVGTKCWQTRCLEKHRTVNS